MKLSLHSPEDAGKPLRYNFGLCNGLNLFPVSGQTRPRLLFLLYSVTHVWVKVMETLSRWPSSFSCQCKRVLIVHRADGDFLNVNWIYNLKVPDEPNQVLGDLSCRAFSWMNEKVTLSCLDVPQALNPCFFRCLEESWAGVEAVTVDKATPSQTVFIHHWCNQIKRKPFDFPVYSLKSMVFKIF